MEEEEEGWNRLVGAAEGGWVCCVLACCSTGLEVAEQQY